MQHTLHHPPIHSPPQQPLQTTTFHNNDVLMGRGGTINAHPGNEQYRKFVERKKRVYLTARFKREKRLIAQSIVDEIRALDPPGRFLLKDARESIWRDVGDEKARDKTSQALRENAGTVRKEMEEEYQETRRQQVRDNAIAMGKCPEEAVKNMMSVAQNAAAVAKHAEKSAKEKKPPAQEPALVAKSSYAVQPKSPPVTQQYTQQPPAPPPAPQQQPQAQGWGYHHQPPSHVQQSQQIIMQQQHNTDPNYPYFVPPTMHSHPPHQQQVVHQPPQPQHHLQPGMQHQQMYGAPAPQQPAPSHSPEKETQQVPNEQYKLFLEWQKSSDNSRSRTVKPQHTISQPIMPPPPPSAWEPTPISEMVANQSTLSPKTAAAASQIASTSPPIAAINLRPSTRTSSRDSSPGSDRHVQFQNDIPLMIGDSKSGGGSSKIQPRVSMQQQQQQQQHHQQGGGDNVYTDYIPDASMSQSGQSTSPRSHANMSQNMSQAGNTHATPLTFLSTDMSVKTSDSLNYYLQGLEDEISGDVGQEVELVAHAPMLDEQQHHNNHGRHHHHHGGIPSYHNRSTPPRYGGGSGRSHGGSSHKSGSGNSRRSRRRRTGNHIPSNSGKVQLDLSNLGGPSPSGAPTFVGAPPQAPQQVHHQHHETVPTTAAPLVAAAPSPTYASGGIPCGAACGDGGVILPTPLRSSTQQPKHSPPSSAAMGPPAPLSSPGFNNNNNAIAPLSPGSMVNSLDLDKMSLCGTENVSHAGGSIGGASLCNVFDDNDDSIIGSGNLMDMTMSLGSGGTIVGSQQAGKSPSTQSLQLGLHYAGGENESLIDMSVGSGGANSKMENSQNSGSGGSSSRSRRSGSPASIDKADVDNSSNKIAEIHQQFMDEAYQPPAGQQETPVPVYGQDFKFSWDSKREE